jgi:predicted DCC family thiol-disulfide oxidoreductase YuxK
MQPPEFVDILQNTYRCVKNDGFIYPLSFQPVQVHDSSAMDPTKPIQILYDGDCPICVRKVKFLKHRDKQTRLSFINIREHESETHALKIPSEILVKQIHAVLPDGKLISRMDVIRAAYREIGLGWLIAPTGWPLLRPLFDTLYTFVAKHRILISRYFR